MRMMGFLVEDLCGLRVLLQGLERLVERHETDNGNGVRKLIGQRAQARLHEERAIGGESLIAKVTNGAEARQGVTQRQQLRLAFQNGRAFGTGSQRA